MYQQAIFYVFLQTDSFAKQLDNFEIIVTLVRSVYFLVNII